VELSHLHLVFATLPIPILFVAFLKLTVSSRPSAPPSGLRFGHWLTGRVSNVLTLRYVLKFRTLVSCLSTSGDQACCIAVKIWLINPLEGLLVRSCYCICTSCVSFVNAFRHCRVITAHCVRSCAFLLSHAMRLWLPPVSAPNHPVLAGKQ